MGPPTRKSFGKISIWILCIIFLEISIFLVLYSLGFFSYNTTINPNYINSLVWIVFILLILCFVFTLISRLNVIIKILISALCALSMLFNMIAPFVFRIPQPIAIVELNNHYYIALMADQPLTYGRSALYYSHGILNFSWNRVNTSVSTPNKPIISHDMALIRTNDSNAAVVLSGKLYVDCVDISSLPIKECLYKRSDMSDEQYSLLISQKYKIETVEK